MISSAKAKLADIVSEFLRRLIERPVYRASTLGQAGQGSAVLANVFIDAPGNVHLGRNALINRGCQIYCARGRFILGDDSHLAGDVYINAAHGTVSIGSGVAIGPKSVILSHSNAVIPNRPISSERITADVAIGSDVFIGASAVILPGTCIGDHAVIGAGSVVNCDVPSNAIFAGVPARLIRQRNVD